MVILLICIVAVISAVSVFYLVNNKKGFSFALAKYTIRRFVGDEINLQDEQLIIVKSETDIYRLILTTLNSNIEIDATEQNIICKSVGNAKVKIDVKIGEVIKSQFLNIVIDELPVFPDSLSTQKNIITLGMNQTTCTNALIICGSTNQQPTVEYSNANICEYNTNTFLITPKNIGSTLVTVKYGQVSTSFTVNVTENMAFIFATKQVKDNYIEIRYTVFDCENTEFTNQNVSVEFLQNTNTQYVISQDIGIILISKSNLASTCIVKLTSNDDSNIFVELQL